MPNQYLIRKMLDLHQTLKLLSVLMLASGWTVGHGNAQGHKVHLELVLAIDTSTSVDAGEFRLQRQGLADAFRHPDVIAAIKSLGPLGIAVSVVQWSDNSRQRSVVDWRVIRDASDSFQFAGELNATKRAFQGMTDIGSAVRFASRSLLTNTFNGERLVIDISGDGTSDAAFDAAARDDALRQGITTNALIIFSDEYDLGDLANINLKHHFETYVIGGFGAFLMSANDFKDYQQAIRRKLIREIIGPNYAKLDTMQIR